MNKRSPRLGVMRCSHRRSLLLGFTTKVGEEAPTLVLSVREEGERTRKEVLGAGAGLVERWPSMHESLGSVLRTT